MQHPPSSSTGERIMLDGASTLFIAGTDTGVGKTVVTAALARCLRRLGYRVGVMKPIETGVLTDHPDQSNRSDAACLRRAAGSSDDWALMSPYRFAAPLAPLDAARAEGRVVTFQPIRDAFQTLKARHQILLVEGAGGLLVPISEDRDMSDVIVELTCPVLVVGRASVGGINHARLTLEALAQRKLPVLACVVNQIREVGSQEEELQQRSTVTLLRERSLVPVLGPLPAERRLTLSWDAGIEQLSTHPVIEELACLVVPPRG
jgi:dethiobiotin synthetase